MRHEEPAEKAAGEAVEDANTCLGIETDEAQEADVVAYIASYEEAAERAAGEVEEDTC